MANLFTGMGGQMAGYGMDWLTMKKYK